MCYSCLSDSSLSRKAQCCTACPGQAPAGGSGRGRAVPGRQASTGSSSWGSVLCSVHCRRVLLGNLCLSHKADVYSRRESHGPRRPARLLWIRLLLELETVQSPPCAGLLVPGCCHDCQVAGCHCRSVSVGNACELRSWARADVGGGVPVSCFAEEPVLSHRVCLLTTAVPSPLFLGVLQLHPLTRGSCPLVPADCRLQSACLGRAPPFHTTLTLVQS